MSNTEAAVLSRLEALRKAGKTAEADKVLTSVLSELEKIPTNPRIKVKLGTKFENDFSKSYELKEDVEPLEGDGDVEFDVLSFLKGEETSIDGDKMRERARELNAVHGQRDAEKLLKFLNSDEGKEASKELRSYYLVFTGTVWVYRASRERCVVYLRWNGGRWCLNLLWLDGDWGGYVRVLSPRKNT